MTRIFCCYLDFVPTTAYVNLRLAVEDETLSTTWILSLDVVVVHLESGVGAGTGQSHDVVLSVVDFDGHFAETVIVGADIV